MFVVGTSVQAGWVLVLSSLLLGAVLAGTLLPLRVVRGVTIERRAPAEAFQGDAVEVELVVRNAGRGLRSGLEVEDRHLERCRVELPPIPPGVSVAIGTSRRAARRGVLESPGLAALSSWPFGAAVAHHSLDAPSRTVVYPAVAPLGEIPLVASMRTHEHSIHSAPRRGTGPEYLGIREYRTGDSMRHVHWPSTARHGHVMVREFEQEHTRRLAIVLDTAADEGEEDTALDACCSVAASVAFAAVGQGRGVRLLAGRAGQVDVLSRAEPQRLLEWLAELRPFGGVPLAELARAIGPHLRGIETVLLVAATWRANSALPPIVGSLAGGTPAVAVALVEAHTFAAGPRSLAMGLSEVEALVGELSSIRADTYRISNGEDLSRCLQRPLARV